MGSVGRTRWWSGPLGQVSQSQAAAPRQSAAVGPKAPHRIPALRTSSLMAPPDDSTGRSQAIDALLSHLKVPASLWARYQLARSLSALASMSCDLTVRLETAADGQVGIAGAVVGSQLVLCRRRGSRLTLPGRCACGRTGPFGVCGGSDARSSQVNLGRVRYVSPLICVVAGASWADLLTAVSHGGVWGPTEEVLEGVVGSADSKRVMRGLVRGLYDETVSGHLLDEVDLVKTEEEDALSGFILGG